MTLKQSLRISLFVHFVAFMLLGGFPRGCSRGGGEQSDSKEQSEAQAKHEKQEEIIDKPVDQPTEITLIEETKEQTELRIERARRKEIAECEPHFGGIGVVFDGRSGRIIKVYKYYPASDAGMQVGDIIEPDMVGKIKGEIGTPVEFRYLRNGIVYRMRIIRGRICTRDI